MKNLSFIFLILISQFVYSQSIDGQIADIEEKTISWRHDFHKFPEVSNREFKTSEKIARQVALKPHLNIGVFALEANAPHWEVWQKNLKVALKAGKIWGSEQIAMNITIYSDNLAVEILPAYCNWILIDGLKFDEKRNTLVEPYLPNHEIGIVHFAGKNNDQIRNNKNHISKVETVDGKIIDIKLRFNN